MSTGVLKRLLDLLNEVKLFFENKSGNTEKKIMKDGYDCHLNNTNKELARKDKLINVMHNIKTLKVKFRMCDI
jgi:hypothetical protein